MTESDASEAIPESQPIDVRNNPESRAAAAERSSQVSRANAGGAPPKDAPEAGQLPEAVEGGAASGNPVAGVTIDEADRAEAVAPDDGPTGHDGPAAGHA